MGLYPAALKTFGLKYFGAKTFIFGSSVAWMVGITTSPQYGFAHAPEFKNNSTSGRETNTRLWQLGIMVPCDRGTII